MIWSSVSGVRFITLATVWPEGRPSRQLRRRIGRDFRRQLAQRVDQRRIDAVGELKPPLVVGIGVVVLDAIRARVEIDEAAPVHGAHGPHCPMGR